MTFTIYIAVSCHQKYVQPDKQNRLLSKRKFSLICQTVVTMNERLLTKTAVSLEGLSLEVEDAFYQ